MILWRYRRYRETRIFFWKFQTKFKKIKIYEILEIFWKFGNMKIWKSYQNFHKISKISVNVHETIFRFIMQNTGKRCVILLVFIILRWSFNYESNVFRYNKILIDCVFGNSKFVVPSTLTIDLGFAAVNSQCLRDNKLAIPSYSVNKYILVLKYNILIYHYH